MIFPILIPIGGGGSGPPPKGFLWALAFIAGLFTFAFCMMGAMLISFILEAWGVFESWQETGAFVDGGIRLGSIFGPLVTFAIWIALATNKFREWRRGRHLRRAHKLIEGRSPRRK